ncbi:ABC transporter substrate-binding protein [Paenibacillus gorillae]|uniref:ABC transporter substrate-binding protein n=1 Tax=Paenibacillus gorillae TaxID=1243662 RepID=UPI0004B2EFAD|nr:extracellular solute-binding protein [Paenibacillus gorillae]
MRKIGIGILLLLAVVLTLCMSAMGTGSVFDRDRMSSNRASESQEPITLRMTYWANSQLTVEKNEAVIRLFEQAYPNIRVKAEYFWGDAYTGNLSVMAATNSLPDIIRIDYTDISEYIEKDLLLPLNTYIESNVIDLRSSHPVHNQGATVNGLTYGINIGNNALAMFYNPQLLKEAGVEPPGPDYTWEQYEADLRTIKQRTGVYGDTTLTFKHFQVWLRQQGKSLYNSSRTGLGYEDDELFVAFFRQQLRWMDEDLVSTAALEQSTRGLDDGAFPKGLTAFGAQTYWSNQIDIMENQLGFPIGLAMYPGSGDRGMYIKPSFYHGIARSSAHPDEAALFIDFFTNNIEAAKSLSGYFGLPYNPTVIASIKDSLSLTQRKVLDYLALVEQRGSPIDPPESAAGAELVKLFNSLQREILYKRITPERARPVSEARLRASCPARRIRHHNENGDKEDDE